MKTATRICLFFTFISLPAEAARRAKECSPPGQFAHTRLDQRFQGRQKFSSGEKVYFNCEEDFTAARGSRSVQCTDGKWSKLTLKCEKKSCGNAGDLPNGQFIYEGNSYIGEKVYAVCNQGYTLKGLNYMICKKCKWTGDFPACVAGATTCSAPSLTNSVPTGKNISDYQPGDELTFACADGFSLDGARLISCGSDGQWTPSPPQCLRQSHPTPSSPPPTPPRAKPTQALADKDGGCGAPPPASSSSKANLAEKYAARSRFTSGEKVYYVCDVGYSPAEGSRSRLCHDGDWTPLKLKCERKLCGSAGEISNGQFLYSGVEFGDTATAVCDEGYLLVGRATRNCLSGGWDGRIPVCEVVSCEDPPEVEHAELKGLEEPPYTYRSVVRYQCRVGTLIGQKELWCTKHGTWSDPPPQCKEISCPPPNVLNAYWRAARNDKYQFRETLSIVCKRGYERTGPSSVICNKDGRWHPGLPECIRPSQRSWRGKQ